MAETVGQLFPHVGHAVSVGVLEHRVVRSVHDIQSVLMPKQAKDGGEVFAEDRLDRRATFFVPANQDDAIDRFRRRTSRVHRVFTDKQISFRITGDGRGMLDVRNCVDQVDLEPRGNLLGRQGSCQQRQQPATQQRAGTNRHHQFTPAKIAGQLRARWVAIRKDYRHWHATAGESQYRRSNLPFQTVLVGCGDSRRGPLPELPARSNLNTIAAIYFWW